MRTIVLLVAALPFTMSLKGQQAEMPKVVASSAPITKNEINTVLMESTFLIYGPSARPMEQGAQRFGTSFIIIRPLKPDAKAGEAGHIALVTAAHVFEDIQGDYATLRLRKRNEKDEVVPEPWSIKIREKGKNLYTRHPTADVAVIDIELPTDSIAFQIGPELANINWLATDDFLKDIAIHPGDQLSCLGYPLGLSDDLGYPILRSGQIASYPIIPMEKAPRILYDVRLFEGNSGAPVYFSFPDRLYKGSYSAFRRVTFQKIFGIVTSKADPVLNQDPNLGIIVPSVYIKEAIDQMAGFEWKIVETMTEN